MTATEKLHQLIQALPDSQINEVLNFADFLHKKQLTTPQATPSVLSPDSEASPDVLEWLQAIVNCNQNTPTIWPKNTSKPSGENLHWLGVNPAARARNSFSRWLRNLRTRKNMPYISAIERMSEAKSKIELIGILLAYQLGAISAETADDIKNYRSSSWIDSL